MEINELFSVTNGHIVQVLGTVSLRTIKLTVNPTGSTENRPKATHRISYDFLGTAIVTGEGKRALVTVTRQTLGRIQRQILCAMSYCAIKGKGILTANRSQ